MIDLVLRNQIADIIYFSILLLGLVLFFFIIKMIIDSWLDYKTKDFFLTRDYVLLEIKIPREINKGPMAMELALLSSLEAGGQGTWYDTITQGKTRPVFSLELASTEGQLHFYIRTEKKFVPRIESNLYAQYPQIEIVESPDYTRMVDFNFSTHDMYVGELKLTKADPIPIKTYKAFDLDDTSIDEEQRVNPIAQVLESLASMKKGEHMWSQLVVRSHKEEKRVSVGWGDRGEALGNVIKHLSWGFDSEKAIKSLRIAIEGKKFVDWKAEGKELIQKYKKEQKLGGEEGGTVTTLTPEEKDMLKSLEENLSKQAYDVGLRVIYLAEKEFFNPAARIGMLLNLYRPFTSEVYNAFMPGFHSGYDYPWQDKSGRIGKEMKYDGLRDYRRRQFFFSEKQYAHGKKGYPTFVLSSEELATIYHLPGSVVQTPTFDRIESTTGQAPANLPT